MGKIQLSPVDSLNGHSKIGLFQNTQKKGKKYPTECTELCKK